MAKTETIVGKMKNFFVGDYGYIKNAEGVQKDILVKYHGPKIKDMVIGGSLITAGVIWMCRNAFFNGADNYYDAEFKVQNDLGLIH